MSYHLAMLFLSLLPEKSTDMLPLNNFNLLSSRSHTIFTLMIESSAHGDEYDGNLIDLAGSESSKTEITGLRRKEGSYINKSLLTLGTGTPVQPTYKEFGYFVMRFMKEMVVDGSLDFVAKWDKENGLTYTQEQIDEVRGEWTTYVSRYM